MSLETKHQAALDALDSALQSAHEPNLDLLAKIISGVCTRISHLSKSETLDRLGHLAKIGAWTDAAFALIALELPLCRVRRLVYENGEWRARSRTSQIYRWHSTTAWRGRTRFCRWQCSTLSSKRAADAMQCRSPYRLFRISSHGRSKSSAVRITGNDWDFTIISNLIRTQN